MPPSRTVDGIASQNSPKPVPQERNRRSGTCTRTLPVVEAAFFDLDKTVIAKASIAAFRRPFYKEGLISRRAVARAVYAQLVFLYVGASEEKLERMRHAMLTLTKGWEQAKVRRIVDETLQEVVEPFIYKEALDLIELHRSAGRRVVIVSAAPEEIVLPLAAHLHVDDHIASRAEIDNLGRYTGNMAFYAYGPNKAIAMKSFSAAEDIDLERSFAYSDSHTDAPMLELVGHPCAVNPDRGLLRIARKNDWEVRRFTHPVRLRNRMPSPRAHHYGIAAAAAGLVLSSAVGYRKLRKR